MNENKNKRDINEQISNYSTEEAEVCQYPERINREIEKIDESKYAFKWEYEKNPNNKFENTKSTSKAWVYTLIMAISFITAFSVLAFTLFETKQAVPPVAEAPATDTEADTESAKTIYIKEYNSSNGFLTPQEIYSLALPSVVSIKVSNDVTEGIGSGFVFSDDGYIATACHVVSGMTDIKIITSMGEEFAAYIVGADELTDLALLKIDNTSLKALKFGSSSSLLVGDEIYAIGTPASLDFAGSMTGGDISFVNRTVSIYNDDNGSLKKKMTLLQTSAALNPGNSGGPVLDAYGKVVGIVTMKLGNSFDGISFVIPSDGAYKILQYMKDGIVLDDALRAPVATHAAKMGIKGESFKNDERLGVKILEFYSEECDAAKKLKAGDVIVSIDGKAITNISSLVEAVNKYSPGDIVSVTVLRSEQFLTFGIILTR